MKHFLKIFSQETLKHFDISKDGYYLVEATSNNEEPNKANCAESSSSESSSLFATNEDGRNNRKRKSDASDSSSAKSARLEQKKNLVRFTDGTLDHNDHPTIYNGKLKHLVSTNPNVFEVEIELNNGKEIRHVAEHDIINLCPTVTEKEDALVQERIQMMDDINKTMEHHMASTMSSGMSALV